MRVLLDTATFLWAANDAPEFSAKAREIFADPDNEIFLSSVSAWEMAVKYALGKLPLPEPPARFVPRQRKQHGIDLLPLDEESALHLSRLPFLHKDPFDRMLVCQAVVHRLVILTADELIRQDPVRTMWRYYCEDVRRDDRVQCAGARDQNNPVRIEERSAVKEG